MIRKLDPEYFIPLSSLEYAILVALAGRPLSGYSIAQQCKADSQGVVEIKQGTLYPALRRLQRAGLIVREETGRQPYTLASTGWLILEQETSRLRLATALAGTAINRHKDHTRTWAETIASL